MKSLILLLRLHQWVKNLFVFLPLFFDRRLTDWTYLWPSIIAFLVYSIAASGIYCFNDVWDAEADKLHPKKCKRPVASGQVTKPMAYALAALCVIVSLNLSFFWNEWGNLYLFAIVCFYLVMNVAYCVRLKQFALLDVFIIAVGFVLRILAGGAASGIKISHWIVLMTFLLALFLAFAKRRDDVVMYEGTGLKVRENVNCYNVQFMNLAIAIVASITMVCYIMYTVSEEVVTRMGTPYLYTTSVFVLAGIMRYLQLTIVDTKSGSPTKVLLTDRFLQACIVGWMAAFFVILYI